MRAQADISITDDLGRTISLHDPAQRIIALYGALNEILVSLDLADRLVARTGADTFLPAIAALPSIGTHMRPNLELIVGLGPDLVLQLGGRQEAVQAVYDLERLGITTAYFMVANFEDLFRVVKKIGLLTGEPSRANKLNQSMRERLDRIAVMSVVNKMSSDRPLVFFEVRSPNLLTVGKASMVTEIIEKAGGINCIQSNRKLLRINDEELLRLAPDVYLIQRGPMNPTPVPLAQRSRLAGLPAVINNHVYEVDEHLFSRPGPRNVDAVEWLARMLLSDQKQ